MAILYGRINLIGTGIVRAEPVFTPSVMIVEVDPYSGLSDSWLNTVLPTGQPSNQQYTYSRLDQNIPSDVMTTQFNAGDKITKIGLVVESLPGDGDYPYVEIGMKHVTGIGAMGSTFPTKNSYTSVFGGFLDISFMAIGEVYEFPLTTPFIYNGTNGIGMYFMKTKEVLGSFGSGSFISVDPATLVQSMVGYEQNYSSYPFDGYSGSTSTAILRTILYVERSVGGSLPKLGRALSSGSGTLSVNATVISSAPTSPTVTSPNGGEVVDKVHRITWTGATDDVDQNLQYHVQLTTNNGSSWSDLIALTENVGNQVGTGFASASTAYSGFPASNAFDSNTSTTWGNSSVMPSWLQYDFGPGNSKAINYYRIYFTNSIPSWNLYDYSPNNWEFQGSNDGSSWTTLDTRSNQGWSSDGWKDYYVSNSTIYRYYRLYVSTAKNSPWLSIPQLELHVDNAYVYDFSSDPSTSQAKVRVRAYDGVAYGPWDESNGLFTIQHVTPVFANVTLSAVGSVTAVGKSILSSPVSLSGSGVLSSTGINIIKGITSPTGSGALSVTGINIQKSTSSLSGIGTATSLGNVIAKGTITLSGAGTITGAGTNIQKGIASSSATGSMTVLGEIIANGVSSPTGIGLATCIGGVIQKGTTTLSATGTLFATLGPGANLSAAGSVTVIGINIQKGTSSLTGAGAFSSSGSLIAKGVATSSGVGSISVLGINIQRGIATSSGVGSATFIGTKVNYGSSSPSAVGSIIGIATNIQRGIANSSGVGSITTIGTNIQKGIANPIGSGSATITGRSIFGAQVGINGTGTLSGASILIKRGTIISSGSGSMSSSGFLSFDIRSNLVAFGAIVVDGRVIRMIDEVYLEGQQLLNVHILGKYARRDLYVNVNAMRDINVSLKGKRLMNVDLIGSE